MKHTPKKNIVLKKMSIKKVCEINRIWLEVWNKGRIHKGCHINIEMKNTMAEKSGPLSLPHFFSYTCFCKIYLNFFPRYTYHSFSSHTEILSTYRQLIYLSQTDTWICYIRYHILKVQFMYLCLRIIIFNSSRAKLSWFWINGLQHKHI